MLGLAACGSDKTPAADTNGATTGPASTSAGSTSPAPVDAGPVVGPLGWGKLTLGMPKDAAEATGAITPFHPGSGQAGDGCPEGASLMSKDVSVSALVRYSTKLGVAVIEVPASMHTPENIAVGSSVAEAKKAYPDLKAAVGQLGQGRSSATVPGNANASYRIVFDAGKVVELSLQIGDQDCYE
jgi:hypothetical protein